MKSKKIYIIKKNLKKIEKDDPSLLKDNTSNNKTEKSLNLSKFRLNFWNNNFHIMCSKHNDNFPKSKRELFDKPLLYDTNGTRMYYIE